MVEKYGCNWMCKFRKERRGPEVNNRRKDTLFCTAGENEVEIGYFIVQLDPEERKKPLGERSVSGGPAIESDNPDSPVPKECLFPEIGKPIKEKPPKSPGLGDTEDELDKDTRMLSLFGVRLSNNRSGR